MDKENRIATGEKKKKKKKKKKKGGASVHAKTPKGGV